MSSSVPLPFVPFVRPAITDAEIEDLVAVLRSGWLTTGPQVKEFEARFADYVGAAHAVAVNSCTAALHLSLLSAGVGPGDEVVTTPLTFCSTANVILHAGATPVFADVDPGSMNLDPAAAAEAITPRTKVLLPVHLGGRPADIPSFRTLAARWGLTLVEDAAHCVEGWVAGEKVGTTADFSCFSFYATKNLTTGEGGMVTTADEAAARWMRIAALHGMSRDAWARYGRGGTAFYDVVTPGFKYNMMDLQAALGLRQLQRLAEMQTRRAAVWEYYDDQLAELPLRRPPPVPAGDVHARHLYMVLVDEREAAMTRDELYEGLAGLGVGASVHFRAVHLHSYYRDRFGFEPGQFPHAESISSRTLSLPLSGATTDQDAERVVAALRQLLSRARRSRG